MEKQLAELEKIKTKASKRIDKNLTMVKKFRLEKPTGYKRGVFTLLEANRQIKQILK